MNINPVSYKTCNPKNQVNYQSSLNFKANTVIATVGKRFAGEMDGLSGIMISEYKKTLPKGTQGCLAIDGEQIHILVEGVQELAQRLQNRLSVYFSREGYPKTLLNFESVPFATTPTQNHHFQRFLFTDSSLA